MAITAPDASTASGMSGYTAIAGAVANSAYSAIGEQSYSNKKERKLLKADVKNMENHQLGYSDAQRASLLAGQNRQASGQVADQMAQMQRAQNASGTGRAGSYDTQRGQMLAGQQAAGAQFNVGVEQASSTLAQNQRADILGRLNAQSQKNTAFWQRKGDIAERGADKYGGRDSDTGGNWADTHEGNR